MASRISFQLPAVQDPTLVWVLTDQAGQPADLVGATVELRIKPEPETPDGDPAVTLLTGADVEVTVDVLTATVTAALAAAQVGGPATVHYRLDVVSAGRRTVYAAGRIGKDVL